MRLSLSRLVSRNAAGGELAITHPSGGIAYGGDSLGQYGLVGAILPSSDTDWAQSVGDPSLNYAVSACLRWITDNLPEPDRQVVDRQADGTLKPRETHPLLDLLERPNDFYDGDALLAATARDYSLTGNAYWLKDRDNLGRVQKLWYVPFWMIAPRWPPNGSQFITDYLYRPQGIGRGEVKDRKDVVHFQWGLDTATGGRLGVHRTKPVLPWLGSLNEGAAYTAAILKNMGVVPNVIISKTQMSPEGKAGLVDWIKSKFTRDGRGSTGVLDAMDAELKQLGLSPNDLALTDILQRPELAVCNTFGIHPGAVHLGQTGGPNSFDNGGQQGQARRASYHDCLMPMTKRFAKTITHRLLGDTFATGMQETAPPSRVFFRFDFSEVEALQEDQNALHKRLDGSVAAGWMMVSEAREKAKLPVEESHKVFYRPGKSTMVKTADEEVEPPEPSVGPQEPEEEERDEPA